MKTEGRFNNPISAVLAGISDRFKPKGFVHTLKDGERLEGKTCLVTGANSGLGFGITVELAKKGAHVIMGCRKMYLVELESAKTLSGSESIEMRLINLKDLDSINDFAENLHRAGITLDVSIHNAGVTPPKARKTKYGLDEMFMVNYLSKFILVNRLLDLGIIQKTTNPGDSGTEYPRIIFISSDSHQGASPIDFDEFGKFEDYSGANRGVSLYSYNKLLLNTFAVELSRRLQSDGHPEVLVLIICPGPVNTNIIRDAPWGLRMVLRAILKLFFKSAAVAARPVIYLAASREVIGKTGIYFHMNRGKKLDPKCYREDQGKLLWDKSEELAFRMKS